jgi:hypothetical protein
MRAAKTSRQLTSVCFSPAVWQAGCEYTSSSADRVCLAAAPVTTWGRPFCRGRGELTLCPMTGGLLHRDGETGCKVEATLIDGQGAIKRLSGKDLAAQLIGDWRRCET